MSAAAALPYPNNGPPAPKSGFNNSGERAFKHIDDLKALAREGYDPQSSIPQLVKHAETAISQSGTLLTFTRPDFAFVEYLRASEIVLNVIPHHKDWTHFTIDQPESARKLKLLVRQVGAGEEQFAKIKQIIISNNRRTGIRPERAQNGGHARTESAPAAQLQSGLDSGSGTSSVHRKPTPSPKPEKLHGRAISHVTNGIPVNGSNGSMDALTQRFATLRPLDTQPQQQRPDSRASNASTVTSVHSSPIRSSPHPITMPSAVDYTGGRMSFDALSRTTSVPSKPQGPRGMTNGAMPPPLAIPNFPQEPPAAYSPARNMETTGNIAPPRHSARSLASSSTRRSSMAPSSSASNYAPNGSYSQSVDYFPSIAPTSRPQQPAHPPRRTSVNVPVETEVSPEKLYDYIPRFETLLIDFRSRAEFDEGHIFARNVMCIEPFSLRQGMSAEDLQESLVLSPDEEYLMFRQRDQYDFVVYYDASTQSEESFLRRPVGQNQVAMKYLHEALLDFNLEKPLKRPPILLQGGVAAWTDMIGQQGLLSSNTSAQVKAGRPIQRRPVASVPNGSHSELRVGKRSRRDYTPFDPEEEKFWREKARAESVVLQRPPDLSEDGVQETIAEEGGDDAAIRTFNERFPEAGNLDKQAFASQRPTRTAPQVPAKVPMYPPAPAPSTYPPPQPALPQAPTRPAPAAPRMSYQGVSDRTVSGEGSTQAPSSSRNLTPYIPPRFLATNIRLPRTGLVNFRNTCYMNSTIQALSATTPLSVFFMDDGYRSQLQPENWKGSRGQVSDHFANLLRSLWKGDVDIVRPTTFRALIRRKASVFDNDDQQDAKELFDTVMDLLHEDMNAHWSRTPLRLLTETEEAKRERMPRLLVAKTEWGRHIHRDLSFIHSLFAGQHASKLTCLSCNFTSTTYEAFTSLSVEIPTDPRAWRNGRHCTLDDCLRSYCSEERLTQAEQWRCPRCKTFREAKKRITLTRAPQFLVIHFKRFATTTRGSRSEKIRQPVDFPLTNFPLDPYMLPPPTAEEVEYITRAYSPQELRTDASMTPPYSYDAYAVVRHIGATMQSGHYITAAKDQGRRCWHMFDDSRVSDFQPEHLRGGESLQNDQAYIVFYQRNSGGGNGVYGGGKM